MFVRVKVSMLIDEGAPLTAYPGVLTPAGVFMPLVDYFKEKRPKLAWAEEVVLAVRLFLQYVAANTDERDRARVHQNFIHRLLAGSTDPATGMDDSHLGWPPRSERQVKNIVRPLDEFINWMGQSDPNFKEFNPDSLEVGFERRLSQVAYDYRRSHSMYGYSWGRNSKSHNKPVGRERTTSIQTSEDKAFPEERFDELLENGFRIGNEPDYRGIAYTLLLNVAGFRVSEPAHLYVQDVIIPRDDPANPLVRIYHPSEGAAPEDWVDARGRPRTGTRKQYLHEEWGVLPRDMRMDSSRAGWKGGLHENKNQLYKQAYWFLPKYAALFSEVWLRYLHQLVQLDRNHPFAFVNLWRGEAGIEYTLDQYSSAHSRACSRIGLTVAKRLGTTPHGHRHAYAGRLRRAGVPEIIRRQCLHHISVESQSPYLGIRSNEVCLELKNASTRAALKGEATNEGNS